MKLTCMCMCAHVWPAASAHVAAAALRGWALLASTLPGHRLSAPFLEASLGSLSKGLYSSAVEVREAAGEAIALLYEAAGLTELEDADSGAWCRWDVLCVLVTRSPRPLSSSVLTCVSCRGLRFDVVECMVSAGLEGAVLPP